MWNNCTHHNRNNNTLQLFLQPLSPRFGYYTSHVEVSSPVYAFPYQMGSPNYQSPRGISRRFGLVPVTPRSPLTWPALGPSVVEAAAVLSPAVARGLNVSSMSTARGINYEPVAEDLSLLKMDRFKVRIVELGDHDDDGHKS